MESVKKKVFYLRDVMKLSFRQIEEQTGIPRKRLAKIYRGHMRKKRIFYSVLDQYQNLIIGWFREYPSLNLEFCRHYGIQIRLCNPGAGNEKGRVERAIRTIKENFFSHVENFSSLSSLNIALHDWVNEKKQYHSQIN